MHIASGVWLRKTATRGVLPSSMSHTLFFLAISYQFGCLPKYVSRFTSDGMRAALIATEMGRFLLRIP